MIRHVQCIYSWTDSLGWKRFNLRFLHHSSDITFVENWKFEAILLLREIGSGRHLTYCELRRVHAHCVSIRTWWNMLVFILEQRVSKNYSIQWAVYLATNNKNSFCWYNAHLWIIGIRLGVCYRNHINK